MIFQLKKKWLLLLLSFLVISGNAFAITLPPPVPPNAIQYEDFYSYSLPILDILYGDYRVKSTPGAIKDGIVLYTGADGQPVQTNFAGMDDAYLTPSGNTYTSFSTATATDPAPSFTGDGLLSWDAQLSALTNYLDGSDLIFFFNNNEDNSEDGLSQILLARGRVTLVDNDNAANNKEFDFVNTGTTFRGGVDANNDSIDDDWVASPGAVDFGGESINHNLGADEAAFALVSQTLNTDLRNWTNSSNWDTFRVEFDLAGLSNGYEQLFIQRGEDVTIIPEPATMLLFGVGLIGLAALSRRKD